jgi:23S rRNA (uracil1939-C5)-methyltransferase
MIEKDKTYSVEVESFANEGKSIARIDNFVIFIDNAIPGDIADVKIYKKKKDYAFGKAIKIIKESEKRVAPKCKYFGVCGGCKWQNLNYQYQLDYKKDSICDSFERIGKIKSPTINDVIPSDDIYYFRNKMEFSFSNKRWLLESEKDNEIKDDSFALGLHVPERYDKALNIDECFLQSENSNKILNFTRDFAIKHGLSAYSNKLNTGFLRNLIIREGKNTKECMVNLVTYEPNKNLMERYCEELLLNCTFVTTIINNITSKKSQVAIGESEAVLYGSGYITETINKYRYLISANSFFQTNSKGTEKLYNVIKNFLPKEKIKMLWDLYCGAGAISIYLSELCNNIIGFELVDSAIKDANRNIEINNIENCKFVEGDLKDRIKEYLYIIPDFIILDPPRSGLHPDVLRILNNINVQHIIYVSCNPQTQARDLERLAEEYNIVAIQPVDMFPHTMHIENVVKLNRKNL